MTSTLTEKQEAILDATLELIGERGFHGTPVSAIAEKAGVGAGTIYRYYESKEDLINGLYIREKQRTHAQILAGVHAGLSVRAALTLIFRNFLSVRSSEPERHRFLEQYYSSPFLGDDTRREQERLMSEYVEIVERGVREGVLRDLPRSVLLAMIFGPILQLSASAQTQGADVDDSIVEETIDALWDGIGAE